MILTSNDFKCLSFEKFNFVTETSLPLKDFLPDVRTICDFDIYLPTLGINLQRPNVWDDSQRSELIESFFKGLLIPPITLINSRTRGSEIDTSVYKVVDGKQRLTTYIMFYSNEFPLIKYGSKFYYNDLSIELKQKFYRMWLKCNVFYEHIYLDYPEESLKFSDEELIDLFEFLNFTGTPQDEDHLIKLKTLQHTK